MPQTLGEALHEAVNQVQSGYTKLTVEHGQWSITTYKVNDLIRIDLRKKGKEESDE